MNNKTTFAILPFTLIALILLGIGGTKDLRAQCSVNLPSQDTIDVFCGDSVLLNPQAIGGNALIDEDFNDFALDSGWNVTASLSYSNPCGPPPDGTPAGWFGDNSIPRNLETIGFDMSCGGQVCFEMRMADDDPCGGCSDCEDPDLPSEGIYFQYSTNGGGSWNTLQYFDPDTTEIWHNWDQYCFDLPDSAVGPNVSWRWSQPNATSNVNDHWGLDNIQVYATNCDSNDYYFDYGWGLTQTSDTTVIPTDSVNNYTILYTDTITDTCSTNVVVNVEKPYVELITSADSLTGCFPDSAQLNADVLNMNLTGIADDFDPGIDNSQWANIQSGTANTNCGSMSGNALHFDGSPRYAETVDMSTNQCSDINFCIRFGTGSSPCENADAGEDVELSYSNDGGATWNLIQTFTPGNNGTWNCHTVSIPAGATTSQTRFKWEQVGTFSSTLDHWALDDVSVSCAPPTDVFEWSPTAGLSDTTLSNPKARPWTDTTITWVATFRDTVNAYCTVSDSVEISLYADTADASFSYNDPYCAFTQDTAVPTMGNIAGLSQNWYSPDTSLALDSVTGEILIEDSSVDTFMVIHGVPSSSVCVGDTDSVQFITVPPPSVNSMDDTLICSNDTLDITSTVNSVVDTSYWYSSGGGVFGDSLVNNTYYVPDSTDINNGFVSLQIKTDSIAPCRAATDTTRVILNTPTLDAWATDSTLSGCFSDSTQLSVDVIPGGGSGIGDDFDPALDNSQWANIQGGVVNDSCGSMTGDALYFNGGFPRTSQTVDMATASCTKINFCIKFGGGAPPCDDADFGDVVVLSYSTDGGSNWDPIKVYMPDTLTSWTCESLDLPSGAISNQTRFKWEQQGTYVAGEDNWSMDDVHISCLPGDSVVTWLPGNTLSDSLDYYPKAKPMSTTNYVATHEYCGTTDTVPIIVVGSLVADFSYNGPFCSSSNSLVSPNVVNPFSGEFGSTNSNVSIDDSSGVIDLGNSPVDTITVYHIIPDTGSCLGDSSAVDVVINPTPEVNAGIDTILCEGDSLFLDGVAGIGATSGYWSSTGNGTFADDSSLTTHYYPSLIDVYSGGVEIVLHSDSLYPCNATSDTLSLGLERLPVVDAGTDDWICEDTIHQLNGGYSGGTDSIKWFGSGSFSPVDDTVSTYTPSSTDIQNGSSVIYIHSQDTSVCPLVYDSLIFDVRPLDNSSFAYPGQPYCSINNVTASPQLADTSTNGTFSASPGGLLIDNTNGNIDILASSPGTFQINYSTSGPSCPTDTTIDFVIVPPPPEPSVNPDVICQGEEAGIVSSDRQYIWYSDTGLTDVVAEDTANFKPSDSKPGYYTYYVTEERYGCEGAQDTLTVAVTNVSFTASPEYGPATLDVDFNNTSADNAGFFEWEFGNGDFGDAYSPSYSYQEAGEYNVILYGEDTAYGCLDTMELLIEVVDDPVVEVPNVFTPNGDNQNDAFDFIKFKNIDRFEGIIFNRWGRKVYEWSNKDDAWDGENYSEGAYYYVIKLVATNGEKIERKGDLMLLRRKGSN